MRFLWPDALWFMLAIPLLAALYWYVLWRKRKSAVRYASLRLIREALGPEQRFKRHVPPLLFLAAFAVALAALARPSAVFMLPSRNQTIVLAMDVSRSMRARDVQPSRIEAAQAAARSFIEELPAHVRVGIVTFAGTASVVQTPTTNREDLLAAIDRFQLQRATATGSGLIVALSLLLPDAGIDLESMVFDRAFSRFGGGAAGSDRPRRLEKAERKDFKAVPPGSYTSGAIILLSDGRRTTGPDPVEAAKMAADRGVRVYTVGFGTKEGGPIAFDGWSAYVMLDEEALKAVAKVTDAEYFHAGSAADLRKVYQSLTSRLALETRDTELSAPLSALAALLAVSAAGLSLLWFHRG
ncbi:MAG: VWA domain-containing protein [Burkholderiales bacterium]|nr:VWA domain-containing protein [Burkholderiales bacterium]